MKAEWELPDGALVQASHRLEKEQKRTAQSACRNAMEAARMQPVPESPADGASSDTDAAASEGLSVTSSAKRKARDDQVSLDEEDDHTQAELDSLADNAREVKARLGLEEPVNTDIPIGRGCGHDALQQIPFPPEDLRYGEETTLFSLPARDRTVPRMMRHEPGDIDNHWCKHKIVKLLKPLLLPGRGRVPADPNLRLP